MRHLVRGLLTSAVIAACAVVTAATNVIPVSAGTQISVHLTDSLSSSSASEGQSFSVVVADPLVKQGWVLVQKGAEGKGHVVAVNPAGKGGNEASIAVQLDYVVTTSGEHIALTAVKGKTTPLVFGVNGSYASNFQKGKDITIDADLVFPGFTSADRVLTVNSGV